MAIRLRRPARRMVASVKRTILPVVAIFILTGTLFGQNTSLGGVTLDPSGAAVPNAKITLYNTQTGAQRAELSDAWGRYNFSQLLPGPYRISAQAVGLSDTTVDDVQLLVNTPATID